MRLLTAPLLALSLLLTAGTGMAAGRGWGLGAMLGEPTGFTAKRWVDQDEAWTFGLGGNPFDGGAVQLHADYGLHFERFGESVHVPGLALQAGLGLRLNDLFDGPEFGIRFPVGLTRFYNNGRLELFAELAPVLDVAPDWQLDLNFILGFRCYFP